MNESLIMFNLNYQKLPMKINPYLLLFCTTFSLFMFSQDMQKGFAYLEAGEYQNAELFFQNILNDHAQNKTARLCFGRAVGLNGNPEKATAIFINLLENYNDDFEVKLNYGESLLWNDKFEEAKKYFKILVNEEPKSFPRYNARFFVVV